MVTQQTSEGIKLNSLRPAKRGEKSNTNTHTFTLWVGETKLQQTLHALYGWMEQITNEQAPTNFTHTHIYTDTGLIDGAGSKELTPTTLFFS